jgi:hypothetical protein
MSDNDGWYSWEVHVETAAMRGAAQAYYTWLENVCELEDVEQEARIYIATHMEEIRLSLGNAGLAGVTIRVRDRMYNRFKKQTAAARRSLPLPEERE